MRRWTWLAILVAFAGAIATLVAAGSTAVALVVALVGVGVAWQYLPWRGRGMATHQQLLDDGLHREGVVVYWRPGCVYCARLRVALGRTGRRAAWVNIWQDADAAAFVRSVNGGDEVVPTVVLDGEVLTNPDPTVVRERLA